MMTKGLSLCHDPIHFRLLDCESPASFVHSREVIVFRLFMPMKNLKTYLSAGLAAAAALQSGQAATIVTLYGPGATNPTTIPATPEGLSIVGGLFGFLDSFGASNESYFSSDGSVTFTSGSNINAVTNSADGHFYAFDFVFGAQAGSANYANISFNGNDGVYEAVGQFFFGDLSGHYLVAIARNDDNSALSISNGKAAIDAVPEPSAIALLSLVAGGLLMRRREPDPENRARG